MSKYTYNESDVSATAKIELVWFGVRDAKGREIGAFIKTFNVTWNEIADDMCGYRYATKPGPFGLYLKAARRVPGAQPQSYGASPAREFFPTEEAAAKRVADYLKGARERATKKATAQ